MAPVESTDMMPNPDEALALLDWQVSMGADEAFEEEAVDRFSQAPATAAQRNSTHNQSEPAAPSDHHSPESKSAAGSYKSAQPKPVTPKPAQSATGASADDAEQAAAAATTLDELEKALQAFEGGHIKRSAKNTVFKRGDVNSRVMIIGNAPETEDDVSGKPFSGRAGALLSKMMGFIDIDLDEDAYVTHLVPWRLPGINRPDPQVIAMCRPFVMRHIELARPEHILILGGLAATGIIQSDKGITQLRGRWHDLAINDLSVAAMVTYGPDYLIRTPSAKANAWRDLLSFKERVSQPNA